MAEHEICEIMIRSVYKGDDGGHREPRSKQLASGEPSDLQQSISQLTIHHRPHIRWAPIESSPLLSLPCLVTISCCRLCYHGTRSGLSLLTSRSLRCFAGTNTAEKPEKRAKVPALLSMCGKIQRSSSRDHALFRFS